MTLPDQTVYELPGGKRLHRWADRQGRSRAYRKRKRWERKGHEAGRGAKL